MVNFASSTEVVFNLDTHDNKNDAVTDIMNIVQIGNGTDTDEGIIAMQKMFDTLGRTPNVQHVGIVLTDGAANSRTKLEAAVNDAKSKGTKMIAIGVGQLINPSQLNTIASSPSHVYEVTDYGALANYIKDVALEICGRYKIIIPGKED